jgi:hypothetical protein
MRRVYTLGQLKLILASHLPYLKNHKGLLQPRSRFFAQGLYRLSENR